MAPAAPLDAETKKSKMREFFHRAYNLHDSTAIEEICAPDIITHGLTSHTLTTREQFKEWYSAFRSSFSVVSCQISHCFVEGDWTTARVEFSGTHTGSGLGPPPSNRRVTLTALILARWHGPHVIENYNELNHLHLLQQIGAIQQNP